MNFRESASESPPDEVGNGVNYRPEHEDDTSEAVERVGPIRWGQKVRVADKGPGCVAA